MPEPLAANTPNDDENVGEADAVAMIELPRDLMPSDGRFGSGPSKVRAAAVEALAASGGTYLGTSHRQSTVRNMVARARRGLAELFSLPDGYEVILGNGGTTAFWDAAVFGLVERKSQHLSFGEFSSKFVQAVAAAPFLDDPDVIESEPGTHPEPTPNDKVDLYALTHNETSTGVQMEISRPRRTDGSPAVGLVAVDATSAAAGLRIDPAQFDCYYFAPQKCFGADGGTWIALVSPLAVERIERLAASERHIPAFLNLEIALANSRLEQTYNTPALATLLLLTEQVEWFNAGGGLEWSASRCDQSSEILYGWAERSSFATPFVAKPDERSHVVGTIDFAEEIDAAAIATTLRANGIVDTDPYRKLGRNQLRVAMFPGIEPADVSALTACIDYIVERLEPAAPTESMP